MKIQWNKKEIERQTGEKLETIFSKENNNTLIQRISGSNVDYRDQKWVLIINNEKIGEFETVRDAKNFAKNI